MTINCFPSNSSTRCSSVSVCPVCPGHCRDQRRSRRTTVCGWRSSANVVVNRLAGVTSRKTLEPSGLHGCRCRSFSSGKKSLTAFRVLGVQDGDAASLPASVTGVQSQKPRLETAESTCSSSCAELAAPPHANQLARSANVDNSTLIDSVSMQASLHSTPDFLSSFCHALSRLAFSPPDWALNLEMFSCSRCSSLARVLTELVSKMRDMQMDKTELGCLRAIILFNPGTLPVPAATLTRQENSENHSDKETTGSNYWC